MTEITAPMKGKIFKIIPAIGDSVSEDEEVVLLDSMKTEISVCAHAPGTVKEIRIREGDTVEESAVMMVLE